MILGVHELLGFKCSFQKNAYCCRYCATKGTELVNCINQVHRPLIQSQLVSKEDWEQFGIMRPFVFESVGGLTRWNCAPPDIVMHF